MCYLRLTIANSRTGMKMTGICINYDIFWNDIQMTADCEFDKDEYSPTERYRNRLAKIMENVWSGKRIFRPYFQFAWRSIFLWLIIQYVIHLSSLIKSFSSVLIAGKKYPKMFEKCLEKDTDCIVFYVGMNR